MIALLLALVLGVLLAQLGGRVSLGSSDNPDTPVVVPAFEGDVDRDSRRDVIGFARTLPFSAEIGAGDEQPLGGSDSLAGSGPSIRIEPVAGANRYSRASLGHGRFVARLTNGDDRPYQPMALGASDTTYWWIDSTARGTWRSVLLSSDPAFGPVELALTPREALVDQPPYGHAVARWVVTAGRPEAWVTCALGLSCLASP